MAGMMKGMTAATEKIETRKEKRKGKYEKENPQRKETEPDGRGRGPGTDLLKKGNCKEHFPPPVPDKAPPLPREPLRPGPWRHVPPAFLGGRV